MIDPDLLKHVAPIVDTIDEALAVIRPIILRELDSVDYKEARVREGFKSLDDRWTTFFRQYGILYNLHFKRVKEEEKSKAEGEGEAAVRVGVVDGSGRMEDLSPEEG